MINYFNTQNSLDNFKFEFDPDRFVPTPTDLNQALKANIGLFNTMKWEQYRGILNFTNSQVPVNDFNKLIDFITSEKFDKIINPID